MVTHSLERVVWLGGGSAAGKSTLARRLAEQHGLQLYPTDDAMRRHAAALNEQEAPYLARFRAMTMDERWVDRSPEEMLDSFHWYRGEGFDLIVDDLLHMPPTPPVIVEGFRLLPRLVAPLLTDVRRAVWLLPTPAFRRAAIEARGTTWDIAGGRATPHELSRTCSRGTTSSPRASPPRPSDWACRSWTSTSAPRPTTW
jgi:hypothetical protein